MRASIDISEVENQTKIRGKYLRALENEEWDLLPGPVYAKSFLRTYGEFLGLDSRMLVDEFNRRYEETSDYDNRPVASLGRERERRLARPRLPQHRPSLPPWVPIGVVLVAVVAALYLLGSSGGSNKSAPGHKARASAKHHRRSPATSTAQATPSPPPKTVTLQLTPTAEVYVCLVDGSGKQLIPGRIFTAGETIPTETSSKLLLTLGNASVHMKLNGSSVSVSPSSSSVGYLLQPTGASSLPAAQQPRCA